MPKSHTLHIFFVYSFFISELFISDVKMTCIHPLQRVTINILLLYEHPKDPNKLNLYKVS